LIYPTAKISERTELKMGKDSFIGDFCLITVPYLKVGDRSQINAFSRIVGRKKVIIGDDVVISYGATILTSTDTPEGAYMNDARPESERHIREGDVVIEDGVFIGANAVIMPNVTIHKRAVIGAGAYIDEDVEPETIVIPWKHTYMKKRS